MNYRPVVLTVLDGWGCRDETHGNAIAAADLPNWRRLLAAYPHTMLQASGESVGLPKGIMGNSEVGHLNLGSGRVVPQGVTLIDAAIASGEFAANETLRAAVAHAAQNRGTLHLMGLLSDGCVHSSMEHLFALIDAAVAANVPLAIHCFLDGRDTPPRSAERYVELLEAKLSAVGRSGAIASVTGRFYAMDRDKRWERTERAYDLLARGMAPHRCANALTAVLEGYARGENDEFVEPTIVEPVRPIADGDAFVFFNFRPDRARQLTTAFDAGTTAYYHEPFDAFSSETYDRPFFATMTKYDENYTNPVLFGPRPQYDTFGDVVAHAGLTQLRLAETEKYAHVTYFFNGGREEPLEGEHRELIASDRSVATYDLAPAMRAPEITEAAVAAIVANRYDVIVMNYANADMVGHTGKWDATIEAVEVLDQCLARLAEATLHAGGLLAVTADHGNAEQELDEANDPITAHTTNAVPFVLIANDLHVTLAPGGKLGDVAPTLLHLMGLPIPKTMTGVDLVRA
ncbi:MAG TPA: 2,3-bisphosphoglycerate-independent phosphoglycerate mutase [Candidatus Cybelea sp.]|jgi:2,3-bisphosphoglycerate-independent phosphoglycerate mutase|nr:2,3-bisphosphoglycerate-independent phosphoglycerate mutase [Candidatus Cybelea sp.]